MLVKTIEKEYDTIVLGGGMSGVVAAIASARNGGKTLIIDENGFFGGALTVNGVGPMMTFFAGEKQVIKGIGQEIISRLMDKGYSPGHVHDSTNYVSYVTPFSAEGLKLILDELVIEAGIDVLFHTQFIDVEMKDNFISTIIISNKDGLSRLKGRFFIDATGDADLSTRAGVNYQIGRENDNATQPMTMNIKVYNVDTNELRETVFKDPEKFPRLNRDLNIMKNTEVLSFIGFDEEFRNAKELGVISVPREDILFFETNVPGEFIINTTRIINESGISAIGLTKAEMIGRQQSAEIYNFLKNSIPGFKNAQLSFTGPKIGVRGTRQIKGCYTLTNQDILENRQFEDTVAHSGYPIDIHNPKGEGTISIHSNQNEEITHETFKRSTFDAYYSIPYRIMITNELDNLVVTGRCVSASFEAQAAIRTTPTMTALGQVAGTAVAFALEENTNVREINIKKLQQKLKKQGVFLEV